MYSILTFIAKANKNSLKFGLKENEDYLLEKSAIKDIVLVYDMCHNYITSANVNCFYNFKLKK